MAAELPCAGQAAEEDPAGAQGVWRRDRVRAFGHPNDPADADVLTGLRVSRAGPKVSGA